MRSAPPAVTFTSSVLPGPSAPPAKRILFVGSGQPWRGGAGYLVRQTPVARRAWPCVAGELHLAMFDAPIATRPSPAYVRSLTPLPMPPGRRHGERSRRAAAARRRVRTPLPRMVRRDDHAAARRAVAGLAPGLVRRRLRLPDRVRPPRRPAREAGRLARPAAAAARRGRPRAPAGQARRLAATAGGVRSTGARPADLDEAAGVRVRAPSPAAGLAFVCQEPTIAAGRWATSAGGGAERRRRARVNPPARNGSRGRSSSSSATAPERPAQPERGRACGTS